jgi:hypothetical protein
VVIETCIKYLGDRSVFWITDVHKYITCGYQRARFKIEPPGVSHMFLQYNHARRLRLKKLLYIELPRSSSGYFKPLLDPGNRFCF